MATQTGRDTRTIQGYLADLLEFARMTIACDVDFTHCKYGGRYNEFIGECTSCQFGPGCRWLNLKAAVDTDNASVEDLAAAVKSAIRYFQFENNHDRTCQCETCLWVHDATQFLRAERRSL